MYWVLFCAIFVGWAILGPFSAAVCMFLHTDPVRCERVPERYIPCILGLGVKTVLQYTRVFRNPDGMIFNTVKNTDAFLSIKLTRSCCIEAMYCSAQHSPAEGNLNDVMETIKLPII